MLYYYNEAVDLSPLCHIQRVYEYDLFMCLFSDESMLLETAFNYCSKQILYPPVPLALRLSGILMGMSNTLHLSLVLRMQPIYR